MNKVPNQQIRLGEFFGEKPSDSTITNIPAFEISKFITLERYLNFVNQAKKDSLFSNLKLNIDSSMCSPECYSEYLSTKSFLKHPAMGVTWDAAMNYAKWLTIKENKGDSITFLYRLPTAIEWAAALIQFDEKLDQDNFYADWLLNNRQEGYYINGESKPFYFYVDLFDYDHPALQRKSVIGKSFFYQRDAYYKYNYPNYYSFRGYNHIGFRLVKVTAKDNLFDEVLTFWKLK